MQLELRDSDNILAVHTKRKANPAVQKSSFIEVQQDLMPTIAEAAVSEDVITPEKMSSAR